MRLIHIKLYKTALILVYRVKDINKELRNNKAGLLSYFRSRANEILSELALQYAPMDFKKKASALNKAIIQCKENLLAIIHECARVEQWSNRELLVSRLA